MRGNREAPAGNYNRSSVARIAPTLLVVGLLAGTAAAFAVTERLKLVRSPIFDTRIEHKIFSPVCDCDTEQTTISFKLREDDRLTASVIDSGGELVRTLLQDEPAQSGGIAVSWDGRGDDLQVVGEGTYRPRIHLAGARQTIVLPNPIRIDTTPPRVLDSRVEPRAFSPDGDGRKDKVKVFYEFSERAHALLFLGERREVRSKAQRPRGKVEWFGRVDGKPLRRGTYRLALAPEDVAGNVGTGVELPVRIRYVELARQTIRVRAGLRFGARVLTDARFVRWRFAGGRGTAEPGLLVLRAPAKPGRYTVFVQANGRADRARVVVGP